MEDFKNNFCKFLQILLHLDPKEFTVEPSTLQSLQQLIQWVADLALNLLVRLPEHRMQKSSGVSNFLFFINLQYLFLYFSASQIENDQCANYKTH